MMEDSKLWRRFLKSKIAGANLSKRSCRLQGTHRRSHRRTRPTWVVGCGCATAVLYGLLHISRGLPFGSSASADDRSVAFMLSTQRMPRVPDAAEARWPVTHDFSDTKNDCNRSHRCRSRSAHSTMKRDRQFLSPRIFFASRYGRAEREDCAPKPSTDTCRPEESSDAAPLGSISSVQVATSPSSPTPSCGEETRFEFIKQTSAAALGISAAMVSWGALLPDGAAADVEDGADESGVSFRERRNDVVPTSRITERSDFPRATPGEDMVWLNEDRGTVASRLSEVDRTFCQGFVAYLARFLLNYDDGCKRFFQHKLEVAVPRLDGSEQWDEFRTKSNNFYEVADARAVLSGVAKVSLGFVASVGFGLGKFRGPEGARDLGEALARKYTSRSRVNNSAGQLATLLSLLPPETQPLGTISYLLSRSAASPGTASDIGSVDLSILEESPTALLPDALRPMYDEKAKTFFVPGLSSLEKRGEVLLAFGTRGPFPISKERSLTAADFGLFAACGALGCTTTHLTVIPLDVVKTRLQTDPGRYEGLVEGVRTIAREEGPTMLLQGFGPTMTGYLWYGITVYPGYELFKRLFIELLGPLNAGLFRIPLVLAASACATSFACIGVCPAEAVRIRQVADPSVGNLLSAARQIVSESGWGKLFEGLPSILFRQISFGMVKFLVFDFFSDFVYSVLPLLAKQTSTQLTVSLMSGLVAGVCAAIVSQPADTVMSIMNRDPGRASIPGTIRNVVREQGPRGLFLGLGSRIVWSGAIISGQFLLYDVCKTALHVSTDDLRVFLDVVASAGL